jgi:hypothetical protein
MRALFPSWVWPCHLNDGYRVGTGEALTHAGPRRDQVFKTTLLLTLLKRKCV